MWVAATSARGLSTPEVYAALDRDREGAPVPAPTVPDGLVAALEEDRAGLVTALSGFARNDLQAAALALRPELAARAHGRAGRRGRCTRRCPAPGRRRCSSPTRTTPSDSRGCWPPAPEVDGVHVLTGPVPGATLVS